MALHSRDIPISILFVGKLGSGKSSFINNLRVGDKEAKEERDRDLSMSSIKRYNERIGNVDAILWDSPGLHPENYQSSLREISTKVQQIDLIVYCLKMDDARFYQNDRETIQHLTEAFGSEIWKHAVIALTFGNRITDPYETNNEEYFCSMLQSWQEIIRKHLLKCTVKESVVQKIPFVPVGSRRSMKLADNKDWKETFLSECMKCTADKSPMKLAYQDGGAKGTIFSLCGTFGSYIRTAWRMFRGSSFITYGLVLVSVFVLLRLCLSFWKF